MNLILGDCLDELRTLADGSIDAVVTDPPYGISFMGKNWDRFDIEQRVGRRDVSKLGTRLTGSPDDEAARKPTSRTASAFANAAGSAGDCNTTLTGNQAFQAWVETVGVELLRVLKPGGHALVFGGTRTYHRLASGLEDAGFEIRDTVAWMFGSGFPKSLDVSKAIDARAGHLRGQRGAVVSDSGSMSGPNYERTEKGDPVTAAAAAWDGWGTALKPAFEPIVVARKPLIGTVAANVQAYGTGALNIDGCRIETDGGSPAANRRRKAPPSIAREHGIPGAAAAAAAAGRFGRRGSAERYIEPRPGELIGRWPANVILDEEAGELLDAQSGQAGGGWRDVPGEVRGHGDTGGASRFFYCAKVSRAERNAGLDCFDLVRGGVEQFDSRWKEGIGALRAPGRRNIHPTVKPIALMRWLCRLVTPPGGTILDPFLGSGTTGIAAALEGFNFVGIEREPDYHRIAAARITFWTEHGDKALDIHTARERRARNDEESGQFDLLAEGAA